MRFTTAARICTGSTEAVTDGSASTSMVASGSCDRYPAIASSTNPETSTTDVASSRRPVAHPRIPSVSSASFSSSLTERRRTDSSRGPLRSTTPFQRGLDAEDRCPELMGGPSESDIERRRSLRFASGRPQQRQAVLQQRADHVDPMLREGAATRHEHECTSRFTDRRATTPSTRANRCRSSARSPSDI